jgi:hypothetical protein
MAAAQALHAAIADHPDAQAKQQLTAALALVMKVQAQDHANASQVGSAAQTVLSQLGR